MNPQNQIPMTSISVFEYNDLSIKAEAYEKNKNIIAKNINCFGPTWVIVEIDETLNAVLERFKAVERDNGILYKHIQVYKSIPWWKFRKQWWFKRDYVTPTLTNDYKNTVI